MKYILMPGAIHEIPHVEPLDIFHDHENQILTSCLNEYPSLHGASRARSGFREADFGHRQIQTPGSFQMGDGRGLP
jgi:hypothetical protein